MTDSIVVEIMGFTREESDFLNSLTRKNENHLSDPWRCDFCGSGCTCDADYLNELVDQFISKYPRWQKFWGIIWNEI